LIIIVDLLAAVAPEAILDRYRRSQEIDETFPECEMLPGQAIALEALFQEYSDFCSGLKTGKDIF
jgi:hypothetical protein